MHLNTLKPLNQSSPNILRSNNLSLDEAITVAQNRPLWRLMSAFGATQYAPLVVHATQEEEEVRILAKLLPYVSQFLGADKTGSRIVA